MPSSPTPTWAPELLARAYYSDDSVVLIHGDCLELADLWTCADVLVTDPPYGLGDRWTGGTWGAQSMYADARLWDVRPADADILRMVEGKPAVVWGGNYFALPPSRCWLAWIKNPAMATMADFELAWTSLDRPAKAYTSTRNPDGKRDHPTQKPVGLMQWTLAMLPDGVVGDPYAGSGTTGVAAKALGRKAVLVERDERYCEIAARRLSQDVLDFTEATA